MLSGDHAYLEQSRTNILHRLEAALKSTDPEALRVCVESIIDDPGRRKRDAIGGGR